LEAITQHFPSNCRKSLTYGQLAAFKVNTEKSSIGFIQCFPKFSDITLQKMKLSEREASFHFLRSSEKVNFRTV
ncbi:hypothetical protein, partial [Treponema porcinum]|uniref:hypothetical protein n=1 Tax=Treponema porcinum TaxID=261392 RepID=UPI002354228D